MSPCNVRWFLYQFFLSLSREMQQKQYLGITVLKP